MRKVEATFFDEMTKPRVSLSGTVTQDVARTVFKTKDGKGCPSERGRRPHAIRHR